MASISSSCGNRQDSLDALGEDTRLKCHGLIQVEQLHISHEISFSEMLNTILETLHTRDV